MADRPPPTRRALVLAFDLRAIIGTLFLVYGAVCLVIGLVSFTEADRQRSGGINVNLWAGIGMLALGIVFWAWTLWRPLVREPASDPGGPVDGG